MYQNRTSFVKGRNFHRTPGLSSRPAYLRIIEVGKLVAVSDLRSEPAHTDYYRRQSWLVSNYVGRVISSSATELVLLNLRTGKESTVLPALGYTICTLSEAEYQVRLDVERKLRENSFQKGV